MEKQYILAFVIVGVLLGLALSVYFYNTLNNASDTVPLSGEASTTVRPQALFDSDGGKIYTLKGDCIDIYGKKSTDFCFTATTLKEFWANPYTKTCSPIYYNCKTAGFYGCINGECISNEEYAQMSK